MTQLTLFLDVDTQFLSATQNDSNSWCSILFEYYGSALVLVEQERVLYAKIFSAMLRKHVLVLEHPPLTLFRPGLVDFNIHNLMDKDLLETFWSWKDKLHCLDTEPQTCLLAIRILYNMFTTRTKQFIDSLTSTSDMRIFLSHRIDQAGDLETFCAKDTFVEIPKNSRKHSYHIAKFLKENQFSNILFGAYDHPFDTFLSTGEEIVEYDLFSGLGYCISLCAVDFYGWTQVYSAIVRGQLKQLRNLRFHIDKEIDLVAFFNVLYQLPSLERLYITSYRRLLVGMSTFEGLISHTRLQNISLPEITMTTQPFGANWICKYVTTRNTELQWKNLSRRILEFCIVIYSQHGFWIPPYVVLEMIDHFAIKSPTDLFQNHSIVHLANHKKKIDLIVSIAESVKNVFAKRLKKIVKDD